MSRAALVRLNDRWPRRVGKADLIVYAPGTQHSSLFPSYLTPGLSTAIAANLSAIKLLITNIQADAEIAGSSAVDIVDRAVYYLKEKGGCRTPTPCLITHYLINDPGHAASAGPYVPLGRLDTLEDPRLVRVAQLRRRPVTGRHDAGKMLGPFVDSFLARWHDDRGRLRWSCTKRVAEQGRADASLEMVRGGIRDLPVDVTVFSRRTGRATPAFVASAGFRAAPPRRQRVERDRAPRTISRRSVRVRHPVRVVRHVQRRRHCRRWRRT